MMFSPKLGNARAQIGIQSVNNGVIEIEESKYRLILKTSSVNFELLSETEQDTLLDNFQGFLNTLSMPLQLCVRVREVDIDTYLSQLEATLTTSTELFYQRQLSTYAEYIRSLVTGNKILSRSFYIVICLDSNPETTRKDIEAELDLRHGIIASALERLGLNCRPLSTIEVLTYLSETYQLGKAKIQPTRPILGERK